jgi:hypothetical protein
VRGQINRQTYPSSLSMRNEPNADFLSVLRKRLRESPLALALVTNWWGLTSETIRHFDLGLSAPYKSRRTGLTHGEALVYPVRGAGGRYLNKYGYCNLPGVTVNPLRDGHWVRGHVHTYYAAAASNRRSLIVCAAPQDLWRTWQALSRTAEGDDFLLISSAHQAHYPGEWRGQGFWAQWTAVYMAHGADESADALAARLAGLTGREVRRLSPPVGVGRTWVEFWQAGGTVEQFRELTEKAPVVSQPIRTGGGEEQLGRVPYEPVDINGAFHNGRLYCTVQTLNRVLAVEAGATGSGSPEVLENLETVVVRSDRTVQTAVWAKAPRGTRQQDRVLRLTDGTLIDREPRPNRYATWSWPSVRAFLDGKSRYRPLASLLRDVGEYLRSSVWLPFEEDYSILTFIVPVTYAQSVFRSVPLIFMNGPAGTGKSQAGRALARVSANACVCGQSSAATIARFIDESRGLVVLDDLEVIGGRGGEFGELVQALKLSYNRETATKLWTDVKTMRTERLNFFGVKLINNTRGADSVLGSRMLRIQTARIPEHLRRQFEESRPADWQRLDDLRDELHTWTFENVKVVDAEYRRLFPKDSDRAEEIVAPLKVFASLAGDAELSGLLELALRRQTQDGGPTEPAAMLREALANLVRQGYRKVSVTHLSLEVRSLLILRRAMVANSEPPDWAKPEQVGRGLRAQELVEPAAPERRRVFGANLRFYSVSDSFVAETIKKCGELGIATDPVVGQPAAFCGECTTCKYENCGCEIMKNRLQGATKKGGW